MVTNLSRVYTQNNEVVTCDVVLNATDEPTFRTFYKTTLAMGTQWFNGDILRNGVYESYELCFIGAPPVYTPIAQNVVKASFTLLTRGETAPPGPPPPLACPGLSIPVDGSAVGEVTSMTLVWTAVTGASTYRVYVWEDGDPQPGSPTTTTADLTYEVTGLSIGLIYRWTVDAVSSGGSVSAGCESATFSTEEGEATIQWQSATFTGDILGASVTLVAVRTGDTSGTASADYDLTEGTALFGVDFVGTPGTVSFGVGEVTQNVVVPLARDYDAEVLAGLPFSPVLLPKAYWNFAESSPATTFNDLTPNGLDLSLSSTIGWSYDQPDINLSTDGTVARNSGTSTYLCRVNINSLIDNGDSFTFGQWFDFNVQAGSSSRTIFHIGGAGGSGQFTYCWCYRSVNGKLAMSWHHNNPITGNTFISREFALDLPEDEPLWIEAGFDYGATRAFGRVNNGAYVYVTWGPTDSPNGLNHTAGRQTYLGVGGRLISGSPSPPNANFGQVEFYLDEVVSPDRYPRWNLDASLTFTATLSNPTGAVLGAIDETTMTIEAP